MQANWEGQTEVRDEGLRGRKDQGVYSDATKLVRTSRQDFSVFCQLHCLWGWRGRTVSSRRGRSPLGSRISMYLSATTVHADIDCPRGDTYCYLATSWGNSPVHRCNDWETIDHLLVSTLSLNSINNFGYSEQVPREDRMRAFRRVARIVHPDKNQHPHAKEAFQNLLRSSRRLKSHNNSMSIFSFYIIRFLITQNKNAFTTHQQQWGFKNYHLDAPQFKATCCATFTWDFGSATNFAWPLSRSHQIHIQE